MLAALGPVLLLLGLVWTGPAQGLGPGPAPAVVPAPTASTAVITVSVGADRQGTTGVSPLAGTTLQLYDGGSGGPTTPVAEDWATCTSDADGDCSFVVPDTQAGLFGCRGAGTGANCDRRFWIVQTAAPTGFVVNTQLRTGNGNGTGSQLTSYQFRTGNQLRAGTTYTSQSDFMVGTGSTNRTASGGVWQQSRLNPEPLQQCGLSVALILDLSGSVTPSQLTQLKGAADTFVDSLVGTPSEMALFSFSTATPAEGATQNYPGLVPISTQGGADTFKARYASWTAGGGTNWDRGLAAAAEAAATYDIAVVITDGDPTFYSQPSEGPGNFNRVREIENGIFSANALKAQSTRVLAVGAGTGVSDPATANNLSAISGPTAYDGTNAVTADYFQVSDYTVVGQALRQLALGECAGSLSVVKQIVAAGADLSTATPAGAGWTFNASTDTAGVTLPTTTATTDATSAVSFPITYEGGAASGTIAIDEPPQGAVIRPVGGANAVCTDLGTGQAAPVTNVGTTGFTVDVPSTDAVSCIVYNEIAAPASVTVDKEWVINGAAPVPEGNQPSGFTSELTLTGPDGAGATPQAWQVTRDGYVAGEDVTIAEEVTLQAPTIDPDLCEVATPQLVEIDGAVVTPVDVPDAGYETTLIQGANTFTIRNTVTCESRLTLAKEVQGSAEPTLWNLAALPGPGTPAGQLPGPSGQATSAAVTDQVVTPLVPYQLAESGGTPTYVQVDQRSDLQTYPLSTGSWSCIRVDAEGAQVSGYADGLNGGVTVPLAARVSCTATNQTGQLVLAKDVVNDAGGTAVPADFTLRAVPAPTVPDLDTVETAGAARDVAQVFEVRPGHPYALSETTVPGYTQTSLECVVDGTPQAVTEISVPPGETVLCVFTNSAEPAQLTLRKVVEAGTTGATETPASWTLTATPQEIEGQAAVSGDGASGVTDVAVFAGSYALSESEVFGYDAEPWACTDAAGATVPVADDVVDLANGADVTCTITNTARPPTLTLAKQVVNDDGGTADERDPVLTATGPTAGLTGRHGDDAITAAPVTVGTYTLSEDGLPGYTASDWTCSTPEGDRPVTAGAVDIRPGDDATCTVLNDDQPGTLTLVKQVVNDHGGTALNTDWTLAAEGPTTGISGPSESTAVSSVPVDAGEYVLSESGGPADYTASEWSCAGGTLSGDTVTVANGEDVACTITNTFDAPRLTLVKDVVNDDGGSATADLWTLRAAGPETISGATRGATVTDVPVAPGTYALSEAGGPEEYVQTGWECEDAGGDPVPLQGDQVELAAGDDVTCTVTNTDPRQAGTWTVTKESSPPSGTQVLPGQIIVYTLRVTLLSGSFAPDVVITDDLRDVTNRAELDPTIQASTGAYGIPAGEDPSRPSQLVWNIGELTGDEETLTFAVRVDDDVNGEVLRNVVTAEGAQPCDPAVDGAAVVAFAAVTAAAEDDCRTTTHPTPTRGGSGTPSGPWWSGGYPTWLSSTGGGSPLLLLGALALVAGGAALTVGGRRRAGEAEAQAVQPPAQE
ncbi:MULTISPECIES: DUF11 domain-containing protein [unclassified Actinotalea]|uniref:prealbumin-like fold domain-containing protein n=1 Tax=unclassified Actinotalea TaxID=2638618 RepID=UPI0015F3ADDC|nr:MULTISPECIES: DUF11 domain-containing protein [unclassified Actinotalea]